MKPVAVTLPDGSKRNYDDVVTPRQVAHDIGKRLEEAAIAAKVNGHEVDLNYPIATDSTLSILTAESPEGLEVLRHSTAHLLAQAVKELYPGSQLTMGPVIEDGFFYDIDCPVQLTQEDLPKIEAKMTDIAGRKLDVQRKELPRPEAIQLFRNLKETTR